ncbi:hypothetical protein BU25DRAFT_74312 [Macroventuria anomochaeta]|uniref:Uncharacterized protein n=1 Tax=Macroventuria anomochaeta TaxID=301207 RepID=A0ACB6RYL9_9PLEO|nr:uncharacterized protein BU25DRAFT_74312 [Macroventuria anomochaeta]KAF2626869.1 hypothetical protein BU25DRAFT_74312 [Macroventuria anomochaeta]
MLLLRARQTYTLPGLTEVSPVPATGVATWHSGSIFIMKVHSCDFAKCKFVAVSTGPYETRSPLLRLLWTSTFQGQYISSYPS